MKNKTILLLLSILLSINCYANEKKIYTWKDKKGVLVFSDTPHVGAKEINLTSQDLNMPAIDVSIVDTHEQKKSIDFSIKITSPEHNQTIRDNAGSVYVTTQIAPRFKTGLTLQLFINDIAYNSPSTTSTFALKNIERGEHTLRVKLFNEQHEIIALSPEKTFFMHRKGLGVSH